MVDGLLDFSEGYSGLGELLSLVNSRAIVSLRYKLAYNRTDYRHLQAERMRDQLVLRDIGPDYYTLDGIRLPYSPENMLTVCSAPLFVPGMNLRFVLQHSSELQVKVGHPVDLLIPHSPVLLVLYETEQAALGSIPYDREKVVLTAGWDVLNKEDVERLKSIINENKVRFV